MSKTLSELHAADIKWNLSPADVDDQISFDQAEGLDNPLAVPLVAALRTVRSVTQSRNNWRLIAQETLRALSGKQAQLDAARRTIAAASRKAAVQR